MRGNHRGVRVLMYSHDSFGLGHLRRCRTIAQSLVARRKGLSVLILSGSPIIGNFDFRTRVDFVRVPGVIKLRNGEYSSLSLHMDLSEVLAMRASIIRHTAEVFDPDVFIVDKEPLGLRGEIQETLEILRRRGAHQVLGLRDVMDDPVLLAAEWERKNPLPALRDLYDDILVYGMPEMCDPLAGIDLPDSVRCKIRYTGYLRSPRPNPPGGSSQWDSGGPFVLVTAGGGGDGECLIDWVLRAHEEYPSLGVDTVIAFGPFMRPSRRTAFRERVARLERVTAITFDAHFEQIMSRANGVVAMGGYNTFCEILSYDRPAVIVPRRRPRREQHIRAVRAAELGLVRWLSDERRRDAGAMADALRGLAAQAPPSRHMLPGMLDGLERIDGLVDEWLERRSGLPPPVLAASR